MTLEFRKNNKKASHFRPARLIFKVEKPEAGPAGGAEIAPEILSIHEEMKRYVLKRIGTVKYELISSLNDLGREQGTKTIEAEIGPFIGKLEAIDANSSDFPELITNEIRAGIQSLRGIAVIEKEKINMGFVGGVDVFKRLIDRLERETNSEFEAYATKIEQAKKEPTPRETAKKRVAEETRKETKDFATTALVAPALASTEERSRDYYVKAQVERYVNGYPGAEIIEDNPDTLRAYTTDKGTFGLYNLAKEYSYKGEADMNQLKSFFTEEQGKLNFGFYWNGSKWTTVDLEGFFGGSDEEFHPDFIVSWSSVKSELQTNPDDNFEVKKSKGEIDKIVRLVDEGLETFEKRSPRQASELIVKAIKSKGTDHWVSLEPNLVTASVTGCGVEDSGLYVYRVHNDKILALRKAGVSEKKPLMKEMPIRDTWRNEALKPIANPEAVLAELADEQETSKLAMKDRETKLQEATTTQLRNPLFMKEMMVGIFTIDRAAKVVFNFEENDLLYKNIRRIVESKLPAELKGERRKIAASTYANALARWVKERARNEFRELKEKQSCAFYIERNGNIGIEPKMGVKKYEKMLEKNYTRYVSNRDKFKSLIEKRCTGDEPLKEKWLTRLKDEVIAHESEPEQLSYRELYRKSKEIYADFIKEVPKEGLVAKAKKAKKKAKAAAAAPAAAEAAAKAKELAAAKVVPYEMWRKSIGGRILGGILSLFMGEDGLRNAYNGQGVGAGNWLLAGLGIGAGAAAARATGATKAFGPVRKAIASIPFIGPLIVGKPGPEAAGEMVAKATLGNERLQDHTNNKTLGEVTAVKDEIQDSSKDLSIPPGATFIAGDTFRIKLPNGKSKTFKKGKHVAGKKEILIPSGSFIPKDTIFPRETIVWESEATLKQKGMLAKKSKKSKEPALFAEEEEPEVPTTMASAAAAMKTGKEKAAAVTSAVTGKKTEPKPPESAVAQADTAREKGEKKQEKEKGDETMQKAA